MRRLRRNIQASGNVPAVVGMMVLSLIACSAETPARSGGDFAGVADAPPVDEAVMSYLMTIRAHHLRADILEERGDVETAVAELHALLALAAPAGDLALNARQDAWARLARLQLERTPPATDDALAAVESGLALPAEDTFYVANLHLARGEVLEEIGDVDGALDAYDLSIAINKRVLEGLRLEP